ncbi:MAG: bifunctional hydroxymethylpyrimidine kinase/phosphomethylpyrimidine kinase [Verrucomicrobiales bacterium]|nr:bifunctional hydroxymethylpyrimidine kinase/phosphomethylpyrimidine kinase [Verrucomicrobiales bacterium]
MHKAPPVALTIAGSDSSSGAGMQADLKTFAAHRIYGVNALTATVAEVPGEVARFDATDATLLGHQLNSVASHFSIGAAKTGMLANGENVDITIEFAQKHPGIPFVIDPVIFATAESRLLSNEGVEKMKAGLLSLAEIVTPNLPEAEALLGRSIRTREEFIAAPRQLSESYGCSFLVKGGHFEEKELITDYAWIDGETIPYSHPRINVADTHGTGCTLSAAICANLAIGISLREAVAAGISYLSRCLSQQYQWPNNGDMIAALNHFPDGVD